MISSLREAPLPPTHPGNHRLNFLGCALHRGRKPKRGQPGCPKRCPPLVASGSLGGAGTWKPEDGQAGAAGTSVWEDTATGVTAPFGLWTEQRGVRGRQALRTKQEGRMCLSAPLAVWTASVRLSWELTNSPLCQDGVKSPGQLTRLQLGNGISHLLHTGLFSCLPS